MKCVFLNTYYPDFLSQHYRGTPDLEQTGYGTQLQSLKATFFGESDFYSNGLQAAGWEAFDIIANCVPLQNRWGLERGIVGSPLAIALEQIREIRPDVVYIHDLSLATSEFLAILRSLTQLIVGQIACPIPATTMLSGLDAVITSFPHFVPRFLAAGIPSFYQPLAFAPHVLDSLNATDRDLPLTFIGGISPAHQKGTHFLNQLVHATDLELWGYGSELLPSDCLLRQRHRGPVWGRQMFHTLCRSQITINRHIDVAENYANNMRLFEATGCGALLITDYKDNLGDLFEIGKEIVAYRSPEECIELIRFYLKFPEEASRIALAGQKRTLEQHTYPQRMKVTTEILTTLLQRRT